MVSGSLAFGFIIPMLYAVVRPTTSSILNGPNGAPVANIHVLSIVSKSATPSAYNASAALKNGTSMELRMYPGCSFLSFNGIILMFSANSHTAS